MVDLHEAAVVRQDGNPSLAPVINTELEISSI